MGIYVCILRCADRSYYVGSATGHDVAPRIDQHNAVSYPGYTFTRRPVVLAWSEYFDRITDGIAPQDDGGLVAILLKLLAYFSLQRVAQ